MTDEIISPSEPTAPAPDETADVKSTALAPAGAAEDQDLNGPHDAEPEPTESFADLLTAFERSHTHRAATRQLEGTVVSISIDQVFLDIGYKTEGVLPRTAFENNADAVKPGDSFPVSVTGRNEEGYYTLTRFRVAQPRDWSALEAAF